jgi:hypothetical protein
MYQKFVVRVLLQKCFFLCRNFSNVNRKNLDVTNIDFKTYNHEPHSFIAIRKLAIQGEGDNVIK